MQKNIHTLLVFAQNKRGVLERISMLIRKKMYNLEQITASDTETEGVKRLTITFSFLEGNKISQIAAQLKNITEIIEVKFATQTNSLQREVGLIKIKRPSDIAQLTSLIQIFKAEVVLVNKDNLMIQINGDSEIIDNFISILKPYQILELGRSGTVAMEK